MFSLIFCVVFIISLVSISSLYFIFGAKKPFALSFKNIVSTTAFWVIINSFHLFTGVKIPFSLLSLGISILCGIPGILLLVVLKTIL